MIVTLDRPSLPSLPEALGIPGARSVSLYDPDGPAVLWWAGLDEPGARQAVAAIAVATAAIALAGPVDEFGDVILTSAGTFHVIRLVGDGTEHVAHLILDRAGANLAMARRDFRLAVAGYAGRPRHAADRAAPAYADRIPPDPQRLAPEQGRPGQPVLVKPVPPGTPEEAARELPRRERSERPPETEEVADLPADWFQSLIQAPFADDESVLDRVLVTLRTL